MQIGIIGLGTMGSGLAKRLLDAGNTVVGYDPFVGNVTISEEFGRAQSYDELLTTNADRCKLRESCEAVCQEVDIILISVPAGDAVDEVVDNLLRYEHHIEVIIDTGNSYYKYSVERYDRCKEQDVAFLDCGVSGGIIGKEQGYCCMVGGDESVYQTYESLFAALAIENGYAYVGSAGAGHFVKMVHNGIEYGLLAAYAEGFHLLHDGPYTLDLQQISALWQHGTIISSFLLTLIEEVYADPARFADITGQVDEGGTGRWTYEEAQLRNIPMPALKAALEQRRQSRETGGNYTTKLIALLRNVFGGHMVHKPNDTDSS